MSREACDPGHELELAQILTKRFRIETNSPEYTTLRESAAFVPAARGEAGARQSLFDHAARLVAARRQGRAAESRLSRRKQRVADGATKAEVLRSEVVARQLARLARKFGAASWPTPSGTESFPSHVQRFRDRFCEGRPLTTEEADRFFESPAFGIALVERLEAEGVTALNHTAEIRSRRVFFRRSFRRGPYERVRATVHLAARDVPLEVRRSTSEKWPEFVVRYKGGYDAFTVRPHTVFDYLRDLSLKLADQFGWQVPDAAQFILTDEVPTVRPVLYDLKRSWHPHHTQLRLELSVSPWLSAESLARLYRQIQRDVLGYAQNRPTTVANLELFDFVAERLNVPKPSSWTEIAREWNKTRPKAERYGPRTLKNIQRDYERIYRQIMFMGSARVRPKQA